MFSLLTQHKRSIWRCVLCPLRVFLNCSLVRSERLPLQKAKHQGTWLVLRVLRVERFSTFQKGTSDVTIALFSFPVLGDNIYCIFASYRPCHEAIVSSLWCPEGAASIIQRPTKILLSETRHVGAQTFHFSAPERTSITFLHPPQKNIL